MIHPDAIGIEGGRVREAGIILRYTGCHVVRAIGQRISIQEGPHGRYRALARGNIRDSAEGGLRQAKTQALIGEEKECSIFNEWPTERSTKIILPLLTLRQAVSVIEPVVGIQNVIPEIVEHGAVKAIGARASDDRNLPTRSTPKFRRVRRGLNTELLHGVNGNEAICPSQ